ncbi:kelch domain containing 2, isoform CRA_e [Rattus norvegicus]|uniref:Kelch domain containing 2, isoform CRA_e n=1 Tax=Rattus norvegicus TaxID=10116 RepID=A6HBW1_RAT|nr:kelch domain containing 2, isoform CRA_e [Rattus norvegicus]
MATRMLERRTCQARPSKATRPWSWPARPSAAATSPSAMGATCSSGAATRKKINTEGDVPPSMSGSCAVCVDRVLYLFGGHHSRGNTNKGKAPSPRAAHACATVGNKGFVFGGRYRDARMNDLHYLNLDTWEWNELIPQGICPVGRSWHSLTPVSSDHLFLFGGFTTEKQPLSESFKYMDFNFAS